MHRLILTFCALSVLMGGVSAWGANKLEGSVDGDGVKIRLTSPFPELPPSGSAPFRIEIRNDANSQRSWQIKFESGPYGRNNTSYTQNFSVAPNSTGTFEVVVPLPDEAAAQNNVNVRVRASGSGLDATSNFFGYFYVDSSGPKGPYTLIGHEVLGTSGTGPIENFYKSKSREFYGGQIETATMPSDWRAYAGVAAFFLSDTEWLALSPAQREAVCNYVAMGGHLNLYTTQPLETRTAELRLPEPDGKPGPYGFGTISLTSNPLPPEASALETAIASSAVQTAPRIDESFSNWSLRALVGTIAIGGSFIIAFVFLFGALIGPINLFGFAGGKNRFRLFWTTPLISIVASVALIIGIFVVDGLGGTGRQMVAIFSLPDSNREAVIQEQVVRTAVLFTNGWHNGQNYLITPVSSGSILNALRRDQTGDNSSYVSTNNDDSVSSYVQNENDMSGDWFRSRSVTGQYLQAVRPSRSVLTILNPASQQTGDAPVVLSSFPDELTEVHLIDAQGHFWNCEHLEPGRKKTCVACSEGDHKGFWRKACLMEGGKLRSVLSNADERPGYFYAIGSPTPNETLLTLSGIRWEVASAVYLGPMVPSPAPENTP